MSHLMVDIETLGTDNNARILSVGIVEFDETNTLETRLSIVAHSLDLRYNLA